MQNQHFIELIKKSTKGVKENILFISEHDEILMAQHWSTDAPIN